MDASMQQKIALTTAHFPARGTIADMGSGSGSGTYDLARLYRGLNLVGVDINPITVEYAAEHYQAANLKFVVGDIADRVFDPETLDGILNSSVLHHVTSFNGFEAGEALRAIRNQIAQLKTGGVLIIRDFVVPDSPERVVTLTLPTTDGSPTGDIPELSTAKLFEVFARDFRSSRNPNGSVAFVRAEPPADGFASFETTLRYAAEFVLRKDYRDHWGPELLEEYTYFTQEEFERAFRTENLRIVVSMPLWNPWIVENRFRNRFSIADESGTPVHFPPTNYLIVGEKVSAGDGVLLAEERLSASVPDFLQIRFYRQSSTGRVFELAERPHPTVDLIPWFVSDSDQLFVIAKKDFPRPIVNAERDAPNLNRAGFSGYITEPISAIIRPDAGIGDLLEERAGLNGKSVTEISEPQVYFTSPGGINEIVESRLVRIDGWDASPHLIENYTRFRSAGTVREMDALQVLRASHVGGMFDARLELNIYRLLRKLGRSAGSWIGAAIAPKTRSISFEVSEDLTIGDAIDFEVIDGASPVFLDHRRAVFSETDAAGERISSSELEYVVPRTLTKHTVSGMPFARTDSGIFVGIEIRDLPAPQHYFGNSRLACVPAWRLPRSVHHKFDLEPFVRSRFPIDFRVSPATVSELGGAYFTSAGLTPEIVYPLAVEIEAVEAGSELQFIRIERLLAIQKELRDAHLLIALNRLGHALGLA